MAETLATEFKFFKELVTDPSCDLTDLVANHMKIVRTFEVKKLTEEVGHFFLNNFRVKH